MGQPKRGEGDGGRVGSSRISSGRNDVRPPVAPKNISPSGARKAAGDVEALVRQPVRRVVAPRDPALRVEAHQPPRGPQPELFVLGGLDRRHRRVRQPLAGAEVCAGARALPAAGQQLVQPLRAAQPEPPGGVVAQAPDHPDAEPFRVKRVGGDRLEARPSPAGSARAPGPCRARARPTGRRTRKRTCLPPRPRLAIDADTPGRAVQQVEPFPGSRPQASGGVLMERIHGVAAEAARIAAAAHGDGRTGRVAGSNRSTPPKVPDPDRAAFDPRAAGHGVVGEAVRVGRVVAEAARRGPVPAGCG